MSTSNIVNKKQIACGGLYTFVLTEDNQLWASGQNNFGQLGLGDTRWRSTFTKLDWTDGSIKQVACGDRFTFILTENNQLWACGQNRFGQLGLGDNRGKKTFTKLDWTGGSIKQVACGSSHTIVLTDDNTLWACGENRFGQLGLGDNTNINTLTKLDWTGGAIKQIACGDRFTFILTENNQLWACGQNNFGQLGLGDNTDRNILTKLNWTDGYIKQFACGDRFTFILAENNQLWACGDNEKGQLGLGDHNDSNILTKLNWTDGSIKQVACGSSHTFVVTNDNQLWACGMNRLGQLGLGDNQNRSTLTKLTWNDETIKHVACGSNYTFVLTEDNQLWACGHNQEGQLGFHNSDIPVFILIKIYLKGEDSDGILRQIQLERLEDQQRMAPSQPYEPPIPFQQEIQEQERQDQLELRRGEQRQQVFEQQREAARQAAEEYARISLSDVEKNIKLLYQQVCDNQRDSISLDQWHELDQDERKNIISISLGGQGRTCHIRDNLIMALNAAQEFVEWERNPLARQMDDEGHGMRPKENAPRYVKFVHDANVFVDRPSTLELLRKPEYDKFNLEIVIPHLRIGNLEGNVLEIGGIHGQAPGHPIARLVPVTGKLFEAPPPLNEVPQQEGGKHKSKYQRQYLKTYKRYRLLKSQLK